MQVLVALANARGEILSRDDLIDACWGGRAVSDDALNRVLSRLRALARKFEGFQVETITKVGYRLIQTDENGASVSLATTPGTQSRESRPGIERRALIAGGAVTVLAAAGVLAWHKPWVHRPPREAQELFRQGEIATRQGFPGQQRQAISYFEQAVRIDPQYSAAWGALALASTHLLEGYDEAEVAAVPGRLQSAAERALAIDPDNADAHFALALIPPYFRQWASMEAELRRLVQRYPDHWLGPGRLAGLLTDVGRLQEAVATWKGMARHRQFPPVGYALLANGMLHAGQFDDADVLLDRAYDKWPSHPALWHTRYRFLLFSGRPQAAAAFVMDPERRPTGLSSNEPARLLRLAQAADSQRASAIQASVGEFRIRAEADARNIPFSASVFALLEQPELSFAAWQRYFLNRGSFGAEAPISRLTRRSTRELFSLPMTPLRADPRFAKLVREIGLEDYWRSTGTQPDYRRV
jgi:tetratricopeptide (TPR) repeat protein